MRPATIAIFLCLLILPAGTVQAAPPEGCAEVVKRAQGLAASISGDAKLYWAHRESYTNHMFGRSRTVRGAKAIADREKANAGPKKNRTLTNVELFQAALETASVQRCLPEAQLRAMKEATINVARRVNFDQFPLEYE